MIRTTFNILFSLGIRHDYIGGACPDFVLLPTADCERHLQAHGLLFRATPDGGVVLFEAGETGLIFRKISSPVSFSFLLQLKNSSFDNYTRLPYPTTRLGKPFYYFSNLSSAGAIDPSTNLAATGGGKVGDKDLGWLSGPVLSLPLSADFNQIELSQTRPGTGKKIIKTFATAPTGTLALDFTAIEDSPGHTVALKRGRYLLQFSGAAPTRTEMVYFDDRIPEKKAWGMVEIFADNTTDYTARTAYILTFRSELWKYYLIDTAGKVTVANNTLTNLSTSTTGLAGLALSWVPEADLEPDSFELRHYTLLKKNNAGKPIFLLRSNRSMTRDAESVVQVKLTVDGAEQSLPSPKGSKSKLEVIQNL